MEGIQNLVTAIARTHLCCAASIKDGRRLFMDVRWTHPQANAIKIYSGTQGQGQGKPGILKTLPGKSQKKPHPKAVVVLVCVHSHVCVFVPTCACPFV